jgi:hypothetical protein
MADVFSALPVAGGARVAVKILRADSAVQSCRREFELADAVDRDVTAGPITYGRAAAGAYLVTSYLPGYRSGTAALGRPRRSVICGRSAPRWPASWPPCIAVASCTAT